MSSDRALLRRVGPCVGAACLVVGLGALAMQPACTKEFDLSRLEGTWVETDSHRRLDLAADGTGVGPYGTYGAGCSPTQRCEEGTCISYRLLDFGRETTRTLCGQACSSSSPSCPGDLTCRSDGSTSTLLCKPDLPTPMFTLRVKTNAFDELMIEYGDDALSNAGLVPCGPCALSDDGNHLSCKQAAPEGGFGSCEFDRLGSGAPDGDAGGETGCPSATAVCGARCVDLATDPANCGGCGVVCDAGACSGGKCTRPTPGVTTTLAVASAPVAIAVDASHVYWADQGDGKVGATSLSGGPQQTLFAGGTPSTSIAVDLGGNVYWTSGSSVWRGAATGAPASVFAPGSAPVALAVDASGFVYWLDKGSGAVMKTSALGGSTTLASTSSPVAIASDGGNVYWTSSPGGSTGSVMKVANSGSGAPVTLASGQNLPFAIAVSGGNVYWTSLGDGSVWKTSTTGIGTPTRLDAGPGQAAGIAVDGTNVYWTNTSAGTVNKIGVGGGAKTVLASLQGGPAGIAVDGGSVYWTNFTDGKIQKLAPK